MTHADRIKRADPYNLVIEGHTIPANLDQEARIRAMDADTRARFLTVMGRVTSPGEDQP